MLGSLNKEKMLEEYKKCNCFVLPSEHETFGIVYREAMAIGRPIITTNHQGFANDWNDAYGLLIDIDDERQLINALLDMQSKINTYDLKTLKTISTMCLSKYSEQVVMKKYTALFLNNENRR